MFAKLSISRQLSKLNEDNYPDNLQKCAYLIILESVVKMILK